MSNNEQILGCEGHWHRGWRRRGSSLVRTAPSPVEDRAGPSPGRSPSSDTDGSLELLGVAAAGTSARQSKPRQRGGRTVARPSPARHNSLGKDSKMDRSTMTAKQKVEERRLTRVAGRSGLKVGRDANGYFLTEFGSGRPIIDGGRLSLEQLKLKLQGPREA